MGNQPLTSYEIRTSYLVFQQATDGYWFVDVTTSTSGGASNIDRFGPFNEGEARRYAPQLARETLNMATYMVRWSIVFAQEGKR
jgi:hypothetical protein